MHEHVITCNIVELVAQAANGRKVHRMIIEVGKLLGVVPDAIAFCFRDVAKGTRLEDASLDIRELEALALARRVALNFDTSTLTTCPCGSLQTSGSRARN
jgi:hydrogenase nickel incorporation protein HypA/HybF